MKKILLFIYLITNIHSDIINITIKKEKNNIYTQYVILDDKEEYIKQEYGSGRPYKEKNIYTIPISPRWLTRTKIIYQYNKTKILNKKTIKESYMKIFNSLKIKFDKDDYLQTFKIKAKPDRKKDYWVDVENKYKIYTTQQLKKEITKKEYERIMREWVF